MRYIFISIIAAILVFWFAGCGNQTAQKNNIKKTPQEIAVDIIAPDFTLLDQNGENHTLSDYRGKNVVLYFYPKDDTPG